MKVALFYDWLNQWGGAENVLLDLIKIYPDSPIYTLVYDPKKTSWLPKNIKVVPSIINKFSLSKKNSILQTPFYGIALEQFNFSEYDIIISTTQISGHYLLTPPSTLFVCYFHNINRYIYQTPEKFKTLKPLLNIYKNIDFIYSKRPDYLLCNSLNVQKRIEKHYHRSAKVIYPGINLKNFYPTKKTSQSDPYFLIVSRLVAHKKINLAIKACHQLNQKLIIVGTGREKQNLIQLTNHLKCKNIVFLGQVDKQKLVNLYQNCQALICPQEEDFGLTSLEAQACGKPVIAYKKGGCMETIIDGKTGMFFKNQTVESLIKTLQRFHSSNFSPKDCSANASKFSKENFMLNFKKTIDLLWQQHQKI